jgi:hypothetical protein
MKTYKVKYQVATYSGEIEVTCEEDCEEEQVIAKSKKLLTHQAGGSLPFGYQYFKILPSE